MKKFFIPFLFIIIASNSFAQTGLYTCNHYEFRSKIDSSKNIKEFDTKILTLDFDAITNKYFMWRTTDEQSGSDVFFKWNIKTKGEVIYNKPQNIVQTIYLAKIEVAGVETSNESLIYKIENTIDKSMHILIYSPKYKTSLCFYNLVKF